MSNILFVDDDDRITGVFRGALEAAGHSVLVAHTLLEAQRVMRSTHIDLAIIDFVLSDGYGTTLIEDCARAHPPIKSLMISGIIPFDLPDGNERFLNYEALVRHFGASGVLQKPFRQRDLMAAVSACI